MDSCSASPVPRWLRLLLRDDFFNRCTFHPQLSKNMYCLDCCIQLCSHCLPPHRPHRLLQIRSCQYDDALCLDDASKLMDCSSVQPYTRNRAEVIFLKRSPTPKLNNTRGSANSCSSCGRILKHLFHFCSLSCKLDYLLKTKAGLSGFLACNSLPLSDSGLDDDTMTPDSILDPAASTSTMCTLSSHVGVYCTALACPATTETVSPPTPVSGTSVGPRHQRKGIAGRAPHPLF